MECNLCIHYSVCKFIDAAHRYGENYDCEKCSHRKIAILCTDNTKHKKEDFGIK